MHSVLKYKRLFYIKILSNKVKHRNNYMEVQQDVFTLLYNINKYNIICQMYMLLAIWTLLKIHTQWWIQSLSGNKLVCLHLTHWLNILVSLYSFSISKVSYALSLSIESHSHDIKTQIKETVHPKLEMCWKYNHAQAIKERCIYLLVCLFEQIWTNLAWHYLLINASSAVNGCHRNKSQNKSIIEKF